MTIRVKFALIMAIPLVLVYIVLNIMQFRELGRTTLNEEREGAAMMVKLQSEEVSAYARLAHQRASGVLATVEAVDEILPHRLSTYLRAAGRPMWIAGIALIDGRVNPPHTESLTGLEPFQNLEPYKDGDPIATVMKEAMDNALSTGESGWVAAKVGEHRTTPIFVRVDPTRHVVVSIAVDSSTLTRQIVTADERAEPWIVVNQESRVILGNPPAAIGRNVRNVYPEVPPEEMDRIRAIMKEQPSGSLELNQPRFWLGWSQVEGTPWRVILPIDMRSIMEPVWAALWRDAIIALVGLALNLTIVALLAGWFTNPIRMLSAAFSRVRNGELDVRVPVRTKDEMGQLGAGFNEMTAKLGDLIESRTHDEAAKAVVERELGIAKEMQESLLPGWTSLPDNATGTVQARMQPAREVGGDFYDAWLKDDALWFTVADVSGKGVAGGLFMAVASTILRGVRRHVDDPADAIVWLNDRLMEDNEGRPVFLTMFLGRLDPDGTVAYASAGHLPAIRFGPECPAEALAHATGPPVAMSTTAKWTTGTLQLARGEHLLIYSDGAIEARRDDGSMVEIEGLVDMVQRTGGCSDQARVQRILESLQELETQGQSDDITIMSVTRTGPPGATTMSGS